MGQGRRTRYGTRNGNRNGTRHGNTRNRNGTNKWIRNCNRNRARYGLSEWAEATDLRHHTIIICRHVHMYMYSAAIVNIKN